MVEIGHILLCKPIYPIVFKAERINAIRKQFSSFIEEDKKRKDRNEYILERLDKIRTSSAIVQVRNAPKDFFAKVNQFAYDPNDYTEKILPMYGKAQYCFNTVDNTNVVTTKSEEEMLKEISQKYILIPRHSNILEYDDNYLLKYKIDDNNDWRKKYSILEQLKQNEKEDEQKATADLCKKFTTINIKDGELNDNKIEQRNLQTKLLVTEFNKHSFEKNQDNLEMTGSPDDGNANVETDRYTKKSNIEKNITGNSENITDLNKPISNSETENLTRNTDIITQATTSVTTPQAIPTSDENVNVADNLVNEHHAVQSDVKTDDLTQKEKIQTQYEMEIKPNEEDIQLEKVQYSNIDAERQINYLPDKGEIEVHDENIDSEKLRPSGIHEPLPVENTNFTVQNTEHEEANIVVDQLESQEVLTMAYPTEEELENTGFETQIDEFVAEQTDMLYSDPNVTNYAYDQTGNHVDYAYYEGIPPEQQVYAGVVNDHEETTEQYDHNYKSQYGDYDQAQSIDVQHDVYDVEEDVAKPEIYEQIQFEEPDYNDIKEVERELDAEQNYNIVPPSQEDDITNIIDEAILPEGDSNVKKS